jgi:hypothetical protein
MILRLLSLAQLQSSGIIIHTNEFYCSCRNEVLTPQGSMEEPLKEALKYATPEPSKDVMQEPIKDALQEPIKNALQKLVKAVQEPVKDVAEVPIHSNEIKNNYNLKKATLRLEKDEENPGYYLVAFSFDASVAGRLVFLAIVS